MCQFAGQQTRSEMEQILVVAATIKEEQAGRDVVVPFMLSNSPIFRNSLPADSRVELAKVNGQPALITRSGERAFAVLTIDVEANQIQNIFFNCMPVFVPVPPESKAHVPTNAPEVCKGNCR